MTLILSLISSIVWSSQSVNMINGFCLLEQSLCLNASSRFFQSSLNLSCLEAGSFSRSNVSTVDNEDLVVSHQFSNGSNRLSIRCGPLCASRKSFTVSDGWGRRINCVVLSLCFSLTSARYSNRAISSKPGINGSSIDFLELISRSFHQSSAWGHRCDHNVSIYWMGWNSSNWIKSKELISLGKIYPLLLMMLNCWSGFQFSIHRTNHWCSEQYLSEDANSIKKVLQLCQSL